MYRISFIFLLTSIFCFSCTENKKQDNTEKILSTVSDTVPAKIKFIEKTVDLGTIFRGEVVESYFEYENIGGQPLIISDVSASCGCTSIVFDPGPLSPGKKQRIKVVFDSTGLINNQYKTLKVKSNTYPSETELILAAFVKINTNI